MTKEETHLLNQTSYLWNGFQELEKLHPVDNSEFMFHIHALQRILISRDYLRQQKAAGLNIDLTGVSMTGKTDTMLDWVKSNLDSTITEGDWKKVVSALCLEAKIYYFGTDLKQAGHYFWEVGDDKKELGINGYDRTPNGGPMLSTHPESIGKHFLLNRADYRFIRDADLIILYIEGSPADKRGGCKSVFWAKGLDCLGLVDALRSRIFFKRLIEKMGIDEATMRAVAHEMDTLLKPWVKPKV